MTITLTDKEAWDYIDMLDSTIPVHQHQRVVEQLTALQKELASIRNAGGFIEEMETPGELVTEEPSHFEEHLTAEELASDNPLIQGSDINYVADRYWTEDEVEYLRYCVGKSADRFSIPNMALSMGRTEAAIRSKANTMDFFGDKDHLVHKNVKYPDA